MHRLVILFLVAGCGFHTVGNGDGSAGDMGDQDLAGGGGGGGGGGGAGGGDMAGNGACAPPVLLVGVENLHNGDTGGGRVARLSIGASDVTPCTTLRGQGLITPQPFAVASFAGRVAAVTGDTIDLVDPQTDSVLWSKPAPNPTQWLPLDAWAMQTPTGTPILAAAYGMPSNPSAIREVDAYDATGAAVPGTPWCIQGTGCTAVSLSLGILSMTANPKTPSHFLALDSANNIGAYDVDPFTNTKTQYVGGYTAYLQSIYTVSVGATRRLAWLDVNNMGAILYATDSGSGPSTIAGPVKCNSGCTKLLHVVPDPTNADGFFALCDGTGVNGRKVIRVNGAHDCTPVLDGTSFGAESRLSRLGF